jgi:probable addiction module antidote protein
MPSYKEDLLDDLRNRPGYAAKYLTAAADDSDEAFLVALRDIATVRTGMTSLAAATKINRVNLYGMLSEEGNPGIKNIRAILRALRLRVIVEEVSKPPVNPTSSPARRRRVPKHRRA